MAAAINELFAGDHQAQARSRLLSQLQHVTDPFLFPEADLQNAQAIENFFFPPGALRELLCEVNNNNTLGFVVLLQMGAMDCRYSFPGCMLYYILIFCVSLRRWWCPGLSCTRERVLAWR